MKLKIKFLLIGILILGLLAKIIFILSAGSTIIAFPDAPDYDTAAMSLLKTNCFPDSQSLPFCRAPGYPIFLYFLYIVSPQNYFLVKIIQSILITLAALFIFKIAKILFSDDVALIATSIFSFHPYFFVMAARLQTESLFIFIATAALYTFFKFIDSKNSKFPLLLFTGLLSGISMLTKPTFIIFIVSAIVLLYISRKGKLFFIKATSILVLSCGLVLLPWIMRNYLLFGEFIFCNNAGGYNFFLGNSNENYERLITKDRDRFNYLNYEGVIAGKTRNQLKEFEKKYDYYNLTPKQQEKLWYRAAFVYIRNNKAKWVKLIFLKACEHLRPYVHPWCYSKKAFLGSFFINSLIFLFGAAGLFMALRKPHTHNYTIFFIFYFSLSTLLHSLYISVTRYRLPYIDLYLYVYASYAFIVLLKKIGKTLLWTRR